VAEEHRHVFGLDDMHGGAHDGGIQRRKRAWRRKTTSVANSTCIRLQW
jgi:hypothetical protein